MASGNVQNEQALVGKYKSGFTGEVPKSFSQPTPFEIKSAYSNEGVAREAFGYSAPASHPTPTAPGKGTV